MKQVPVTKDAVAVDQAPEERAWQVAEDVAYLRLAMVNIVFIGRKGENDWLLVDAGIPGMAGRIRKAAEERFGEGAKPAAIILTHAHFDHVGSLSTLLGHWDVPVYAHPLEERYLDGSESYPPPDTGAGGGLMSQLAPLYPRSPVNIAQRRRLPNDGQVPFATGWKWIHVPGHTPGMVALWREEDRVLISADAVVTTAQESAYAVAMQEPELHGPPMYFTQDWDAARDSVRALSALEPATLVPGHGRALAGGDMRHALNRLAEYFDAVARPD